jgi:transcriptional regulator of heat shock response
MKKDLPANIVEDIFIAVVLESETPTEKLWSVYLLNMKNQPIETILITSKGYGFKDGVEVKTSVLRHMIDTLEPNKFAKIEIIDEQVFGLNNEYWLSYYIGKEIFDKKFIFLPESIVDFNMIKIPLVNKPGVMIGV